MEQLYGMLIGSAIGLIFAIILSLTILKGKTNALFFICIIALSAITGIAVQSKMFSNKSELSLNPDEQIQQVIEAIDDTWIINNGGFSEDQIEKSKQDDTTPLYDDKEIKMNCYDFGSYIVFSYDDGNQINNISFYKSKNGLILDGVMNVYSSVTINWFWVYDNTFKWITDFDSEPHWWSRYHFGGRTHDNFIKLSSNNISYLESDGPAKNWDAFNNYLLKAAATFTGINATTHFIKFDNIEIIGSASNGYLKINSFYNMLYNSIKGYSFNTTKLIDSTKCLCIPIPTAIQKNYPIPEDKKTEYNNAEYYGVYNCNIAVNLTIKKGNSTLISDNDEYINRVDDEKKQINQISSNVVNKLTIDFNNTTNSDISAVDFGNNNIIIKLASGKLTKLIKIDNISNLKPTTVLLQPLSWNYEIISPKLCFESLKGSFELNGDSELIFNYSYSEKYTTAEFSLNLISGSYSYADFSANPITITLINKETNTAYSLIYNDSILLKKEIEIGLYSYAINCNSEIMKFPSMSGSINIDNQNYKHSFNYIVKTPTDIIFDVEYCYFDSSVTEPAIIVNGYENFIKMNNRSLTDTYRMCIYENSNSSKLIMQQIGKTYSGYVMSLYSDELLNNTEYVCSLVHNNTIYFGLQTFSFTFTYYENKYINVKMTPVYNIE